MSERAKWTPGPWLIEKYFSNGCECGPMIMGSRRPDGTRKIVASVAGAPYLDDDGGENTLADARLIAAAPAMAEAIRAILDDADGDSICTTSIGAIEKARAAMALAERGGTK